MPLQNLPTNILGARAFRRDAAAPSDQFVQALEKLEDETNPYATVIDRQTAANAKHFALRATVGLAADWQPADFAAALTARKQVGMSPGDAKQDLVEVKRQVQMRGMMDVLERSPHLASYLVDNPGTMILAQDKLPLLVNIAQFAKEAAFVPSRTAASLISGTLNVTAMALRHIPLGRRSFRHGEWTDVEVSTLQRWAQRLEEPAATWAMTARVLRGEFDLDPDISAWERTVLSGFESAISFLPFIITAGLSGGAIPAGYLALAGGGVGFTLAGGEARARALSEGVDPDLADIHGALQGAIEFFTEAIPIGRLAQLVPTGLVQRMVRSYVTTELATEQAATFFQDLAEQALLDPEKSWGEFRAERLSAAGHTVIATIAGLGFTGAVMLPVVRSGIMKQAAAAQAGRNGETLAQIDKMVGELRDTEEGDETGRSATVNDATTKYVEEVFGADEVLRITFDDLVAALDEADITLEELSLLSPSFQAQYGGEAMEGATSEEFVIPLGEWTRVFAGQKFNQELISKTRIGDNEFSAEDAKALFPEEGRAKELAEGALTALEEAAKLENDNEARRDFEARVAEQLLRAAPTLYSPLDASIQAKILGLMYQATADRAGVSFKDQAAQFSVQVFASGAVSMEDVGESPVSEARKAERAQGREAAAVVVQEREAEEERATEGLAEAEAELAAGVVEEEPAGEAKAAEEEQAREALTEAEEKAKARLAEITSTATEARDDLAQEDEYQDVADQADRFEQAAKKRPTFMDVPGIARVLKYLLSTEVGTMTRNKAHALMNAFNALPSDAEFKAAALAGQIKQGWYERSVDAILKIFGPTDAPRFAALLAAMSPRTSVEANLVNALSVWVHWVAAGRPTRANMEDWLQKKVKDRPLDKEPAAFAATILRIMGESVQGKRGEKSVLDAWTNNTIRALTAEDPATMVLSGPKVQSFMRNLHGHVNDVTLDAWMAVYAALNQDVFAGQLTVKTGDPGRGPAYVAMSAKVRRVAADLTKTTGETWTPAEVQETIWSWTKTLMELAQKRQAKAVDLLKQGELTEQLIAGTADFATLFTQNVDIRLILEQGGYGNVIRALEADNSRTADAGAEAAGRRGAPTAAETKLLLKAAKRIDVEIRIRARRARIRDWLKEVFDTQEKPGKGTFVNKTKTPALITNLLDRGLFTGLNVDLGGGASTAGWKKDGVSFGDRLKKAGLKKGLSDWSIVDPFNREEKENHAAVKKATGKAASVTIANVLNVLETEEAQRDVLEVANLLIGPGGKVYISVYDAPKGTGPSQQGKSFQRAEKLEAYLPRVQAVFPNATIDKKNKMIVASRPGKLPAGEFFQEEQESVRGSVVFPPNSLGALITLGPEADLTTFLHESMHLVLRMQVSLALSDKPPPAIVKDLEILRQWTGAKDLRELASEREFQEKVARGWETYLFTGKAPSGQLKQVFFHLKSWFQAVYKSLKSMDVQLTSEVEGVFNRMLAADTIIDEAVKQRGALLMGREEMAKLTEDEWEEYQLLGEAWRASAQNALGAASLANMKWLNNAQSRALKKLQRAQRAVYAEAFENAENEVAARKERRAEQFLATGELVGEDGEVKRHESHRLDEAALIETYKDADNPPNWEALERRTLNKGKDPRKRDMSKKSLKLVAKEGGLHPDVAARLLDYQSGDELIAALVKMYARGTLKQDITALADLTMIEEHFELATKDQIELTVNQSLHDPIRARMVAIELRALGRSIKPATLIRAAKLFAATAIGRQKVGFLRPRDFVLAEARAAKNTMTALQADDLDAAATHKQNQLLNSVAAREASLAREEITKRTKRLRKIKKRAKSIGRDTMDQIHALMALFGMEGGPEAVRPAMTLEAWVKAESENGLPAVVHPWILAAIETGAQQSVDALTVVQFLELTDAMRSIEQVGRNRQKLLKTAQATTLAEAISTAVRTIKTNARKVIPQAATPPSGFIKKIKDLVLVNRYFDSLIRELDGWEDGGPLWELLSRPKNEAANWKAERLHKAYVELNALMKTLTAGPDINTLLNIPAIGMSLSRENRLMVALNAGSPEGYQRLLDGGVYPLHKKKLEPEGIQAIIDTLTKEETDFVQAVWDFNEGFWPEIAAKETRLNGYPPKRVEARPVQTRHGVLRGGFLHISFDSRVPPPSGASLEAEDPGMMAGQGLYTSMSTDHGYVRTRVAQVKGRPLLLSFDVITRHVQTVVHDLAFHEWTVNANRILRHPDVVEAITEHYGQRVVKQLRQDVDTFRRGELETTGTLDGIMRHIRKGAAVSVLAFSFQTALIQPLGLFQAIPRLGTRWVFAGLARAYPGGDGVQLKGINPFSGRKLELASKYVMARSSFMRERQNSFLRELTEFRRTFSGKRGLFGRALKTVEDKIINDMGFSLIRMSQSSIDNVIWLGAEAKAAEEGRDPDTAAQLADQAVRDTQGSGVLTDRTTIENTNLGQLFTLYWTFFSRTYAELTEISKKSRRSPADVMEAMYHYSMVVAVPVAITQLLFAVSRAEEPEEEMTLRAFIAEGGSFLLNTMPLVRELAGPLQGFDYRGPASVRVFAEVARLGGQIAQWERDEAFYRAFAAAAGTMLHLPSAQADRTVRGIMAYDTSEDWKNWKRIAFGPEVTPR